MLEKLSKKQEELLLINRDKYIKKFLNSDEIDLEKARNVISYLYSNIKLPMPEIIISSNPMQMQIDANKLKGNEEFEYIQPSWYLGIWYASFYTYTETYFDLGVLNETNSGEYLKIRDNIDSNIYSALELNTTCFICPKPIRITKNTSNVLNSTETKAIEWADGWGLYYVNGLNISELLFNQLKNKEYSFEMFSKEDNEEIKSVVLYFYQEAFGGEFLFRFLSTNLKEIDEYVNNTPKMYLEGTTNSGNIGVYTLFKGTVNDTDVAYVRCYCPSTDRMFFLGVDPENINAKNAIASLCQIPTVLIDHLNSIRRQGEIFSFNFNEKGKDILKSISKEELANTIPLKGDMYFTKIQYEY
jgi:hypothetical protein